MTNSTPKGPQTAIGDALKQALAAHRGQPLAGMLLVTDGQSNGGEDPHKIAQQAGKLGVPIHVLGMGTEQGPSNVRLTDLEVSPVVFVRDPIKLAAVIDSQGLRGQSANVRLELRKDGGDWSEVGQVPVVLGEDGAVQRVEFDYTPDTIGQIDFRATATDVPNELTDADNSATQSVKVVRQRIRVLMVAGYAAPEVQFMRNALLRDQAIEFSSWLQSATENYEQVGYKPLRRLPATQAELNHYDVIILFDPQMRDLGQNLVRHAHQIRRRCRRRIDLCLRRVEHAQTILWQLGRQRRRRRRLDAHAAGRVGTGPVSIVGRCEAQRPRNVEPRTHLRRQPTIRFFTSLPIRTKIAIFSPACRACTGTTRSRAPSPGPRCWRSTAISGCETRSAGTC